MASWIRSSALFALFLAISSSSSSSDVATTVHDVLQEYGLPKGLLPSSVTSYTLSDNGDFFVTLPSPCYVQFEDLVYYDTTIKGTLTYGSINNLSGIQAKKFFVWVSISGIEADFSSKQIEFHVGFITQNLPFSMFQNIPACKNHAIGFSTSSFSSLPCRDTGLFSLPSVTEE